MVRLWLCVFGRNARDWCSSLWFTSEVTWWWFIFTGDVNLDRFFIIQSEFDLATYREDLHGGGSVKAHAPAQLNQSLLSLSIFPFSPLGTQQNKMGLFV